MCKINSKINYKHLIFVSLLVVVLFLVPFRGGLVNSSVFSNLSIPSSKLGYTSYSIPNTDLNVVIPSSYIRTAGKTAGLQANIKPHINLTRLGQTYAKTLDGQHTTVEVTEAISIYSFVTDLKAKQWLHENVTFQGISLAEEDTKTIEVGGKTVVLAYTSCCGGYTPTYVFSHLNKENQQVLVIFTTNAMLQEKQNNNGNYLLDQLIFTLTSGN